MKNGVLIILTIIIILLVLIQYCFFVKMCADTYIHNKQVEVTDTHEIVNLPPPTRPFAPIIPPSPPMYPLVDPVKIYDYQKLNDPLEEPTKRVDRYLLGPIEMRRMFNYPVRGDPDNPRWLGLLIYDGDDQSNKILKLFGRQKYPKSDHYQYYTMINMGLDQVKVHIRHRKELYDDDEVKIPELNRTYRVKLNKDDDMAYNPYF